MKPEEVEQFRKYYEMKRYKARCRFKLHPEQFTDKRLLEFPFDVSVDAPLPKWAEFILDSHGVLTTRGKTYLLQLNNWRIKQYRLRLSKGLNPNANEE